MTPYEFHLCLQENDPNFSVLRLTFFAPDSGLELNPQQLHRMVYFGRFRFVENT